MIPLFKVIMSPSVPAAIAETIASGTVTEGPRVLELESKLTDYLGVPVLTVNSGTSALHLAAMLAINPGDEVISTPITCAATNLALLHAGARIVWADVVTTTGLIDPVDVARKVTPKTCGVMAVDWGGALCDFATLKAILEPYPLAIIEDAAHAFGAARTDPQPDATCWSFQAIKHLNTGDGGGLYVRDKWARDRARRLRWFGIDRRAPGPNIDKPIADVGFKYHMNDLAATIGLANFELAKADVDARRENAAWYHQNLRDIRGLSLPARDPSSAWWLYTVRLRSARVRQEFIQFAAERGVECSRVHSRNDRHPVFSGSVDPNLPGVDSFDSCQVAIPVGGWVGEGRAHVAQVIHDWSRSCT